MTSQKQQLIRRIKRGEKIVGQDAVKLGAGEDRAAAQAQRAAAEDEIKRLESVAA